MTMKIADLLTKERVDLDSDVQNKEEAIQSLAELLDNDGLVTDFDQFIADLHEREEMGSTGMGHGIAIPHAKSGAIKEAAIAFARSDEGIEFDSIDDKPAHLLFMLATPDESNNEHLELLKTLSRKLVHEDVREQLKQAESYDELMASFE